MIKPHWLSGVAEILRAETDDLRELARIGGVDPRTAYIGTRLDGVDLRGQDLRGMLFTDLDLARVQHDAETKIDPNQLLQPPNAAPIILLAARRWSPQAVSEQLRISQLRIIERSRLSEFRLAIGAGANGLIIGHEREQDEITDVLMHLERDATHAPLIIQGRDAKTSESIWSSSRRHLKIVFCNEFAMPRAPIGRGLGADTLSLIRLLLDNPDRVVPVLSPFNVYFRAVGRGAEALVDAGAQILDRIWQSDLQEARAGLFASFSHPQRDLLGIQELLSPASMQHVAAAPRDMHAFVELGGVSSGAIDYGIATTRAWNQFAPNSAPTLAPFRRDGGGELIVEQTLNAWTEHLHPRHLDALGHLRFSDIGRVVVSPYADLVAVVSGLLVRNELRINARDIISTCGDDYMTVWSLIAGQMRRFALSQSGAYRQAYLELILRAGARLANMQKLLSLLGTEVSIRLERFESVTGACRFRATVSPKVGEGRIEPSVTVDVYIDKLGPGLTLL